MSEAVKRFNKEVDNRLIAIQAMCEFEPDNPKVLLRYARELMMINELTYWVKADLTQNDSLTKLIIELYMYVFHESLRINVLAELVFAIEEKQTEAFHIEKQTLIFAVMDVFNALAGHIAQNAFFDTGIWPDPDNDTEVQDEND